MKIVFLFYDEMTALDAVGPHEILCRLPGVNIQRAAVRVGDIQTDSGLSIRADCKIDNITEADILFLPGSGNATILSESPEILHWVKSIHATTRWTTSVCTGSLILGAAGLLEGHKATTHWAVIDRLTQYGAYPIHSRIVEDGKFITGAGVSAGIDMALALAAKISGEQVAKSIQLGIEYDPEPPFDSGSISKAEPEIIQLVRTRLSAIFDLG